MAEIFVTMEACKQYIYYARCKRYTDLFARFSLVCCGSWICAVGKPKAEFLEEKTVTMMFKKPIIDSNTFEDIVEGRYSCPTLLELRALAESEVIPEGTNGMPEQTATRIRKHFDTCPDCQETFEVLKIIAKTAMRAKKVAVTLR